MPRVHFTPNLRRHLAVETAKAAGDTVGAALTDVFARNPQLRSYILDDQGRLRTHVVVYVDGRAIRDRVRLTDRVAEGAEVHVMQALSGG